VVLALLAALLCAATADARTLGERTLGKGDRGWDVVTLQRVLAKRGFSPGTPDGIFGRVTKVAVKRFQKRRRLYADGRVGPLTTHALADAWPVKTATYYGPGLYGNGTACGQKLGKHMLGVAHRSLPCGTRVFVYANGRLCGFRVIDRGPFKKGISIDLTKAAAGKLHMTTTQDVRFGW
jgi:peptidoglycan hydrolase-like protein with peptidoglycan-binding domain